MPLGQINLEYFNLNAERAFPFSEAASRTDVSGAITLPNSFFVALQFSVHSGLNVLSSNFFLSSLALSPTGYSIGISYDDGSSSPPLAAIAAVPRGTHVENRAYGLLGVDSFEDCIGSVTIGVLSDIDTLPPGVYQFDADSGQLEAVTIWPMLQGLSSLTIVNGADRSAPLHGDFELIAGANCRLVFNSSNGITQIGFNAIAGEGLNQNCDCVNSVVSPPIRRINGVPPDNDGNFRLAGESCVNLVPTTNGLTISNSCATPCCGCAELDAVHQNLDKLSNGVATFQGSLNRLATEVSQMSLTVLSSRLGDTSACSTC